MKPSFILLHVGTRFFQHYLLKILSFLQCALFVSLSKKKWLKLCGPISRFSLSNHWSPCPLFVPTPCYFGVAFCNHVLPREVTSKVLAFQCSLLLHEGSPLFSITQYFLPKSRGHKGRTHRNYLQDNKGEAVSCFTRIAFTVVVTPACRWQCFLMHDNSAQSTKMLTPSTKAWDSMVHQRVTHEDMANWPTS